MWKLLRFVRRSSIVPLLAKIVSSKAAIFKWKKIYYYIGCGQIIITSTWSDSRVISETFGVSDITRQYIYYFQWEFWQCTILIYAVFDWKIFKSFFLHCSLLLTMVISLKYFAIYIIQKTDPCIDSFTFYFYRYHLFLVLNFAIKDINFRNPQW